MTMRAVTLRRKQEKRKKRLANRGVMNGADRKAFRKENNDSRRQFHNLIKRQLNGGAFPPDEVPFADWELELLGWKSGDVIPEDMRLSEAIPALAVYGARLEFSEPDPDNPVEFYDPARTVWAQNKTGNKYHKVSISKDGTITGYEGCSAAVKANWEERCSVPSDPNEPRPGWLCAKCAN